MSALDRKLFRDLWQMRSQALAISLVLASGVAVCVMSLSTLKSLSTTKGAYYERYRFAEVFTQLKRAPNSLKERIAAISGVARVQTRVVAQVTLDVPGLAEPAVGRLISIPDFTEPALNALHLRRGRRPEPGRAGEVLANEIFADAHGFKPGDELTAVINGRRQDLRIVGIALSPEYVIQIQGGDLMPDDRRFGVFWMNESVLAPAHGMHGAFNDVALTLERGANTAEVIRRLDQLTAPYGGLGAHDRRDQLSARYLDEEIGQLRTMGLMVPAIFLAVAAFLLSVVLQRLVRTQRQQIAVLKAFGYSRFQVAAHYFKFVLLVTLAGSVIGTAVGVWLGRGMTRLYTTFYRFPLFGFELDVGVVLLAVGVALAAATLGVFRAVRNAAALPPAEAMRAEPPANYRPALIERLGLQRLLTQGPRMVMRHLERYPMRAAFTIFGVAMAAAIMILGSFSKDALDYLMDFQFRLAQRQDMTITFIEPTSAAAIHEVSNLPGVLRAEPFRSAPVRLRFGHRSRRLALTGLPVDGTLHRLLNVDEQAVELPAHGVVLNTKLAELLAAKVGDRLEVEFLEGERARREATVTGLVTEYSGTGAYMDARALNRLLREGENHSGAHLLVDSRELDNLYRTLKETPRVAVVNVKNAAVRGFEETVAENLLRMRFFNVIFAGIIAFGVVYNSARISLSERQRELATMRVLGFRESEVSLILLGELTVLTLIGVPLGLLIGRGLAGLISTMLETELYRIPAIVGPATHGFAAVTVLLAALVSGLVVRRRIGRLDLVSVLKEQE